MNVLPCAGALDSLISPPSSVASSRLMARPSPVPPYLRLVPASACWKASKMSFCFSGAMPIPVSLTAMAIALGPTLKHRMIHRPSFWQRGAPSSATWPWAVNLKAFDSRFFKICCSRFESVVKVGGRRRRYRRGTAGSWTPPHDGSSVRRFPASDEERNLLGLDRDRARFDFRQIENVVDER